MKTRKNTKRALFIIITLTSFLLFYYFKTPFILYSSDEFGYLTGSILLKRTSLFLGRFGFILLYHLIFKLFSLFYKIPLLEAHQVFKTATIILSSLTIGLWYLFLEKFFSQTSLSLTATLLMFANYSLLRDSSSIMTDLPFLLILVSTLFLLKLGIDSQNPKLIFASAVIFGLGSSVREQIFYYLPWLSIVSFYNQSLPPLRSKFKVSIAYFLIVTLSAMIFPTYLFLKEGQTYIQGVIRFLKLHHDSYISEPILPKAEFFFFSIPLPILVFFSIGLYCVLRSRPLITIASLIPSGLSIATFAHLDRLYLPLWLSITPLATYGFYQLANKLFSHFPKQSIWENKKISRFFLVFFASLYTLTRIANYSQKLLPYFKKASQSYLEYRDNLLANVPPTQTLFLIGNKTWLISSYLRPLFRPNWEVVPIGWSWPEKKEVEKQINANLAQKNLVLIDPGAYPQPSWEKKAITNIVNGYSLKSFNDPLYQITNLRSQK